VEKIFRDMTSELITAQPAAPVEFMINFLRKNYLPADAKESLSEPLGAKDDEYKDEGKSDDSSEDDEDDYADYVEPAPKKPMAKRYSIAAPKVTVKTSWAPPVFEKTPEQAKFLTSILSGIFFIKALTRKEIAILVAAMKEIAYSDGDDLIKQGAEGDMFYIVESGSCNVSVEGVGKVNTIPCPSKEDPSVERRYVGELALLYDAPRNATVTADGAVTTSGAARHSTTGRSGPSTRVEEECVQHPSTRGEEEPSLSPEMIISDAGGASTGRRSSPSCRRTTTRRSCSTRSSSRASASSRT